MWKYFLQSILAQTILYTLAFCTFSDHCLQYEYRFGIKFCSKCQPGYKSGSFMKCTQCLNNDYSSECNEAQSNQKISTPQDSGKTEQFSYDYLKYRTDFKNSIYGFLGQGDIKNYQNMDYFRDYYASKPSYRNDPNCLRRNYNGQCILCKNLYIFNTQTLYCKQQPSLSYQQKLQKINCLIYSDVTNKCIECKYGFGLNQKNQCSKGLKRKENSEKNIFKSDQEDTEDSVENIIEIPLRSNKEPFFYLGQIQDKEDNYLIPQQYLQTSKKYKISSFFESQNRCTKKKGKKCVECQTGYFLNNLFEDIDYLACEKISAPISKLRQQTHKHESQIEEQQIYSIINQHLQRYEQKFKDQNCLRYSKQNLYECQECKKKYYYSKIHKQCTKIDSKCLRYSHRTGKCYFCQYGYMVQNGKCVLLNRKNYQYGYKEYMNSPNYYFRGSF